MGGRTKTMRKTTLLMAFVLLPFILSFFVKVAHAENGINLLDLPAQLGEKLGIGAFAGGILATSILILIFVLPTGMLIRKHGELVLIAETICLMSFSIAVLWCPVWILLILCLIIGLMYSGKAREWVSGRGQ